MSLHTILRFFCLTLVGFGVLTASTNANAQQTIREIQVKGVERIEPATVLTYLDVRVGDPMNRETLNRALKSLFATGLFADVSLRQSDRILEVTVLENPVISQIEFEGNDAIEDEQLRAEVQLRPRNVFTRTRVQSDVNRLFQIYQRNGRFSATIEPKIIKLDQNRVNLVFEINEGPVTEIKSIRFVGNDRYDDDKLRSVISSSETRWYRFLNNDDRYDPDRLGFDQELLRRFYLSQGYADFRIVTANAELSNTREHFFLTFTVDEGPRYRVNEITVNSALRNFDKDALLPSITFEAGDWYDADEVTSSIDNMTDELGNRQFAFVNIRPDIRRNRAEKTLEVVFNINETPRVFVERIDIQGNVRTLDKVIRREMDVVEGDPFNRSKIAKSERNVNNLGYFESATVTARRGSAPDRTVLDVEVSEQSTGELSIGAGFSTSEGALADFSIRERNFLGKGQDLLLSSTLASERTEFNFSFTEPYFLNRDLLAGFDAFHVTRDLQDESSYDQRRSGGALRMGYPLSEKWRQVLRYRLERNDITDISENASRFIRDQEGQRITSAISQRITFDDRDSILFPTNGLWGWFDTEFAGLGGDATYVSSKVGASYFYPIADRWVFNLLGEGGGITAIGDDDIQINERYFLGGNNLRGFESGGLGPRDIATDDALGGNLFYRASAELSFPLGLPEELGIRGHAFNDIGSLWDLDSESSPSVKDTASLRASAGLGISWRSPFGPIRVDYAVPYLEEDFDKDESFRFNFGTRF
jgi:outer membrane protein insertion porin family